MPNQFDSVDLSELCQLIEMPVAMTERVLAFDAGFNYAAIGAEIPNLQSRRTWDQAVKNIQQILGDDPDGVKILACMLRCALQAQQIYQQKGIPQIIYVDTMKFFSRFVNDNQKIYGTFAFVEANWIPRQLSRNEFRIDSLEYETLEHQGEHRIYIHIADDSDMSLPQLRSSYEEARRFFAKFFPEYADVEMYCDSWLLCPILSELLPENSKILAFQRSFEVTKVDHDSTGFLRWVYGRNDLPTKDLLESTSLQRRMKSYLLQGGKVGWACGKLARDPFRADS